MRIDEVFNRTPNDDLPYDVIEDVHFHMIDDDAFYRKHYLPCMDQVKKTKDENTIKEIVSSVDDDTFDILDLFINNITKLDTLLEDSRLSEEIKNRLDKVIISNTVYKKQIGIISNNGIMFTKQLLQEAN